MPPDVVGAARDAVQAAWAQRPRCGVVLGTGLGPVVERIERRVVLDYQQLPGWPRCTAPGHAGRLVCGTLGDVPVVAIDGRFHAYEGRAVDQITLGARLVAALGAEILVLSNAAGGLNPKLRVGDLVVIADHINLLGRAGRAPAGAAQREASPYDPVLRDRALAVARRRQIPALAGTYVAVTGPNYETRAEVRFLRRIGGDVVGMSTVPEVLAARQLGLRCLAVSVVTNVARPDAPAATSGAEVVAAAQQAAPRLCGLVVDLIRDLAASDRRGS